MNPQGKGIRSIQKVRLMHAAVRYHVQKSGQWNNDWGLPINQEDMLGTNLAFSFVILRGLRQIGCSLYFEEARAFMHLWNVIGAMLGIREELLPADEKDAMGMANYIMSLRFRPSEAGRELTKALLGCLEAVPPYSTVKGFATTYMRYLVGDEVANILGLPPSNWSKTLITGIRAANAVRSMASHVPDEHTESLFDQMIKNKQKTSFEIPLNMRGAQ